MNEATVSILVILMRLAVPFFIFKFPLLGMFLSMGADFMDVEIMSKTGFGFFADRYHQLDKFLDLYYLFFAFLISRGWKDVLARQTAGLLFYLRALAVLAFELSGLRFLFILGPNIFENFFIFRLLAVKLRPRFALTYKNLFFFFLFLGIPKIIQEYLMHYLYPDQPFGFILSDLWQKLTEKIISF